MCLCTEIGDSGIVILRKTGGRKEEKKREKATPSLTMSSPKSVTGG